VTTPDLRRQEPGRAHSNDPPACSAGPCRAEMCDPTRLGLNSAVRVEPFGYAPVLSAEFAIGGRS
jgi:hypothetical protein